MAQGFLGSGKHEQLAQGLGPQRPVPKAQDSLVQHPLGLDGRFPAEIGYAEHHTDLARAGWSG